MIEPESDEREIDWDREPGPPGTVAEEFPEGTYYWNEYGYRTWVETPLTPKQKEERIALQKMILQMRAEDRRRRAIRRRHPRRRRWPTTP